MSRLLREGVLVEFGGETEEVWVDFLNRLEAELDVLQEHLTEQWVLNQLFLDAAIT